MPQKARDPCKKYACKIQDCLEKNNYQENLCLDVLEEMRQCCLKWQTESFCCKGIDLTKVYIKTNNIENNNKNTKANSSS